MNKKITDEELINAIYEYVGQHIVYPDYTILNIKTYVQNNKIINIIKYTKNNEVYGDNFEPVLIEN